MSDYPKMYIVVKDTIPLGLAMAAVGHAALAAYLEFKAAPIVEEWLEELEDKKWLKSAANTREGQRLSTTKIKGIWHGLTWKQKIIAAALVLSAILSSIAATIGSTQTVIKIFQF